MALSALNRDAASAIIADTVNRLVQEFNRLDTRVPVYAADTGSGTAYAIASMPGITQYTAGQLFVFRAVNANTSVAPTLNVNGKGAGTITHPDGSALGLGDIAANATAFVAVSTISPLVFHLLSRTA